MYCNKCGNEVKDTERFCGACGAEIEGISPNTSEGAVTHIKGENDRPTDGKLAIYHIGAAVLFVLEIILWFVNCLKISGGFGILSESFSMHNAFTDVGILSILTVIMCAASAVMCFLPIMQGTVMKRRRMILQKIVAIWCFAWFVIEMIGAFSQANGYGGLVEVSITFGGWLFILVNIALIAMLFVMTSKNKKLNQQ